MRARTLRAGFTLTELLVTITVIGILAALSMGGLHTARESARATRTKSTILKLHNIVMEMYDTYPTRRLPINIPATATLTQVAQVRLAAIRDIMRMEMPECPLDITAAPGSLPWGATWSGNFGVNGPALRKAYLRRGAPSGLYNVAETLYLWVTISNPEARGQFADDEIGDTDGDGWPEFVDSWGNPIMFLRWAPGFVRTNGADTDFHSGDATTDHDPLDPMRVDGTAWRMVPLIYSPGRDGIYDIELQAGYNQANPYASSKGQPKDLPNDSRTATGPANGYLEHTDNIHNHRLEVR